MNCKILHYKRGEQVKVKIKRIIIACLLGIIVLIGISVAMSRNSALDTVSYGHQVIQAGHSEINIALPFEIGGPQQLESDNGYVVDTYQAPTQHIIIDIEAWQPGRDPTLPTVEANVKELTHRFELNGVTDLVTKDVQLEGASAVRMEGTYRSRGLTYRFYQYAFESNGVLWNILYQYPVDDTIGADIVQQIQDHIQVIPKKEG